MPAYEYCIEQDINSSLDEHTHNLNQTNIDKESEKNRGNKIG